MSESGGAAGEASICASGDKSVVYPLNARISWMSLLQLINSESGSEFHQVMGDLHPAREVLAHDRHKSFIVIVRYNR